MEIRFFFVGFGRLPSTGCQNHTEAHERWPKFSSIGVFWCLFFVKQQSWTFWLARGFRTQFLELSKGLVRFSRGVAFHQARLGARYLDSRCEITEGDKTVIWFCLWCAATLELTPFQTVPSEALCSTHCAGKLKLLQPPNLSISLFFFFFFGANSCRAQVRRCWETARKMSRVEKMETCSMTSGLGWTLRSIKHLSVDTRPLAFLTQA